MRTRQIMGYLILVAAIGFGAYKITASDLIHRMGDNWYVFLGVFALVTLLVLAMLRVLRA